MHRRPRCHCGCTAAAIAASRLGSDHQCAGSVLGHVFRTGPHSYLCDVHVSICWQCQSLLLGGLRAREADRAVRHSKQARAHTWRCPYELCSYPCPCACVTGHRRAPPLPHPQRSVERVFSFVRDGALGTDTVFQSGRDTYFREAPTLGGVRDVFVTIC
jgi:hypothetical protein